MTLVAHPVPGKQKAVDICNAFIKGAPKDATGDVFFGVNHANLPPLLRAKALGRPWYYVDNAYTDRNRGTYFRVTRNALQCSGAEPSDGSRWRRLGIEIKPWREKLGDTILVCEQNQNFMATAVGWKGDWARQTLAALNAFDLPYSIRLRPWNPDKAKSAIALIHDLDNLHLVVTHSSASAITAMLEGVPAISMAGAAHRLTGPLTRDAVLNPPKPEGREAFAHALADAQFTLDEIRSGEAWRWLHRSK